VAIRFSSSSILAANEGAAPCTLSWCLTASSTATPAAGPGRWNSAPASRKRGVWWITVAANASGWTAPLVWSAWPHQSTTSHSRLSNLEAGARARWGDAVERRGGHARR
jgi:hypothetical protein